MGGIKIGIGFGLFRLGMPSPETICAYAERAEDLGIDSIWLSDHIAGRQPHLEISCVMALFAARTKRIKMGPSVLTLPARDPVQVARTYATLDYLSGSCGRVIMAVGLGSDPRDCLACGIKPEERVGRLEEGVEVLRKLWAGPNVSHQGTFYHFDDVTIEPRPAKGALDIWIGGRSNPALRRTAKYGDGWFPSFVSPAEFQTGMAKLTAYGAQLGRTIDPREAGIVLLTYANRDRSRARQVAELVAQAFRAPAESMATRCAIGTPEECVAKIQTYVAAGCTKYVLFPIVPPDELVAQIELYGREIVPGFQ
ncbi:MAG TPA: LLM class flavin-dependent oxidoreductase [Candidatus Kryptonia bacterium]|nr:LLM class flavin-dependent oxidoreductase [Candidatus Kryptonia bacterium]